MEGAWETFKEFRRCGIELLVQGGQLRYQSVGEEDVPEHLLRAAARYRAELYDLVRLDR